MLGQILSSLKITNGHRYIDKVLTPHALSFLHQMPKADSVFQNENARLHRARIDIHFIPANHMNRMDWPALPSDLSCIAHVWDVFGRAVSARRETLFKTYGVSCEMSGLGILHQETCVVKQQMSQVSSK